MRTLDFQCMFAADSKAVTASILKSPSADPRDAWRQIIDPVEPFLEAVSKRLNQIGRASCRERV